MVFEQLVVLAILQGITEFLPISSSAHLILLPHLTSWSDQGLMIDIALHIGTLLAVMLYCARDIINMAVGLWSNMRGRKHPGARLFRYLVIATIPIVPAGAIVHMLWPEGIRSLLVIAIANLIFGFLLWAVDQFSLKVRKLEHMTWVSALTFGVLQVISLMPGVSRSGITMTAGRLLGFERVEAARFSMLMSIPTIIAAGALTLSDVVTGQASAAFTQDVLWAIGLSFVAALTAIILMMRWLAHCSFTPFVVYRILLGIVILIALYQPQWLQLMINQLPI